MADESRAETSDRINGTVRPDEEVSDQFRSWYWKRVRQVLREVLKVRGDKADLAYTKLKELEQSERHSIFYHSDPLAIAADLAGRKGSPITHEEKERYQNILDLSDRPSDDDLKIKYPED